MASELTRASGDRWTTEDGYTILRSRRSLKGAYYYVVFAPEGQMSFDGLSRRIVSHGSETLKAAATCIVRDRRARAPATAKEDGL